MGAERQGIPIFIVTITMTVKPKVEKAKNKSIVRFSRYLIPQLSAIGPA